MPRVKKHVAKFDTYNNGKKMPVTGKPKSFRTNRKYPQDENDTIFCPKGEIYYTWKFRRSGIFKSRTYPKQSQLTQSDFLSTVYGIMENTPEYFEDKDMISAWVEDVYDEIEQLRDEQEEKRDNMPYQLQDSGSGETLQNRYDSLQEWLDELDNIREACEDEEMDAEEIVESYVFGYQGE